MLDRCSLLTFAAYISHREEAWLFLEAPRGLPEREESGMHTEFNTSHRYLIYTVWYVCVAHIHCTLYMYMYAGCRTFSCLICSHIMYTLYTFMCNIRTHTYTRTHTHTHTHVHTHTHTHTHTHARTHTHTHTHTHAHTHTHTHNLALKQYIHHEGIPVDHLVVRPHIPKDRRHLSKPNTAVLFAPSSIKRYMVYTSCVILARILYT